MSAGEVILEDRPCRKCEYNVRGLRWGEPCPECGTPITARSGRGKRYPPLTDIDLRVLRRYRVAFVALVVSGFVIVSPQLLDIVFLVIAAMGFQISGTLVDTGLAIASVVALLAALAWPACVWVITTPRPVHDTRGGPKEWRTLRLVSRLSQVALPVGIGIAIASAVYEQVSLAPSAALVSVLSIAASAVLAAVAVGWIPFAIYLSLLADWAADQHLADRLRGASWFMAVGTLLLVVGIPLAAAGVYLGTLLAIFGGLATAGASIYGALQVTALGSEMKWAMINNRAAEARAERRAERERRRMAEEEARLRKAESQPLREAAPLPSTPVHRTDTDERDPRGPRASRHDTVVGSDAPEDIQPYALEDEDQS